VPISVLFGLDLAAAKWGISRDLDELASGGPIGMTILTVSASLPVLSLVALLRKRWMALVPLALSLGLFVVWGLYYATDWWANQGQGAWVPAFVFVLLGWLVLLAAIKPPGRRGAP
jgi:CHASE2 domain-containing sensor protein